MQEKNRQTGKKPYCHDRQDKKSDKLSENANT